MSRYAEGTSVPMERSRAEVEKTLLRYGAHGFAYSWERRAQPFTAHARWCPLATHPSNPQPPRCTCGARPGTIEREVVVLGFKMKLDGKEREVRLEVPMPHERELGSQAKAEAATRQRWRALVLVLKAKLEAVASGISTLESEFLAGIVLPNGMTVGQAMLPRLSDAVTSGRLLPPAPGVEG
jgi:hypothetical protein